MKKKVMQKNERVKPISTHLGDLAEKYYGTRDLSQITPFQLDKLTTWALSHSVKRGATADRRAGRSKGRFVKGKFQ